MKAFIIYTPHAKSIEYANVCLKSFQDYTGWEPELFEGVTTDTLSLYENKYKIKTKEKSRAVDFWKHERVKYYIKKSCSLNHYRLFRKCVKLNEPIAIIEHDSHCIASWDNYVFNDVMVLNIISALKQDSLRPIAPFNSTLPPNGINNLSIKNLFYRHDPNLKDARIMPGTGAYAITPSGAQKMIDVYENIGWEQSDHIINTGYIQIQTIVPELFTFKLPNLATSHGENLL